MTAEVITLGVETTADLPPDRVLESAVGKLSEVLVLGYEAETGEPYFAGSSSERGGALLLVERFKKFLLDQ